MYTKAVILGCSRTTCSTYRGQATSNIGRWRDGSQGLELSFMKVNVPSFHFSTSIEQLLISFGVVCSFPHLMANYICSCISRYMPMLLTERSTNHLNDRLRGFSQFSTSTMTINTRRSTPFRLRQCIRILI